MSNERDFFPFVVEETLYESGSHWKIDAASGLSVKH
jgi:hypothetical protein